MRSAEGTGTDAGTGTAGDMAGVEQLSEPACLGLPRSVLQPPRRTTAGTERTLACGSSRSLTDMAIFMAHRTRLLTRGRRKRPFRSAGVPR